MKSALIVFAKAPVPGRVKTRLTSRFSPEDAARLYAAFLEDSLEQYAAMSVNLRLYMAEEHGRAEARSGANGIGFLLPEGVRVFSQKGKNLGARMERAFNETFTTGYDRAVIVGSDHPTLPIAFLERAFAALRAPEDVVIGPAEDGGYYLLGMTEANTAVFRDMRYSHASVFEQTMSRLEDIKASVTVLPSWYDVDRPEELERLAADLEDTPAIAPRTRAVLRRLIPSDASAGL